MNLKLFVTKALATKKLKAWASGMQSWHVVLLSPWRPVGRNDCGGRAREEGEGRSQEAF